MATGGAAMAMAVGAIMIRLVISPVLGANLAAFPARMCGQTIVVILGFVMKCAVTFVGRTPRATPTALERAK
tara:strand:- start:709 stop:924 length:216 start_codon:yes stop_codon:yes gene_type:complete